MGKVIDVFILSKRYISLEFIRKTLLVYGIKCEIDKVQVMDNWRYENIQTIPYQDTDIGELLLNDNIITISAMLNHEIKVGIQLFKEDNEILTTDIWMDTTKYPYMDEDLAENNNAELYKIVTNIISQYIGDFDICAAALGVEQEIFYDINMEHMINNSSNVTRWVVPANDFEKIDQYEKEYDRKYDVYLYTKKYECSDIMVAN